MDNTKTLQSRITEFWSAIAKDYEAHEGNVPQRDTEEHAAWVRAIRDLLPSQPSDVLDVATGTGFVASIATSLGHRVTGIDLAEPMLGEAAAQTRGARFLVGDAVAPPFAPQSFDCVISRHLLWTLRDPDGALRAWRELLRPEGRVVAIDGFWFAPLSEPEQEANEFFESFYTREAREQLPGWQYFGVAPIVALFERAGFKNVTVRLLDDVQRVTLKPPSPQPSYALVGSV